MSFSSIHILMNQINTKCSAKRLYWIDQEVDAKVKYDLVQLAFILACYRGHKEVVEHLINKDKTLLDAVSKYQFRWSNKVTGLMVASYYDQLEIVQLLLSNGASVNQTIEGKTALYCAVLGGNKRIVHELLYYNANVDGYSKYYDPISQAITYNYVEIANLLLSKSTKYKGESILSLALKYNSTTTVNTIFTNQVSSSSTEAGYVTITDGESLLMTACKARNFYLIKKLLSKGVEVPSKLKGIHSELFIACMKEDIATVSTLISSNPMKDSKFEDFTPLMIACGLNNIELVNLLLDYGVNINQAYNGTKNDTALHFACKEKKLESVQALLKRKKESKGGSTSTTTSQKESLACDIDKRNSKGETALFIAVDKEEYRIVCQLLEHGAGVDISDKDGNTPLITSLRRYPREIMKKLLNYGADANKRDQCFSPLFYSCLLGEMESLKLLLDFGANLNFNNGTSLLRVASESSNIDVIKLLVERGINIKGISGSTALFEAVIKKQVKAVEVLLNYGANPNTTNADRETPLLSMFHYKSHCDYLAPLNINAIFPKVCAAPTLDLNIFCGEDSAIFKLLASRVDVNQYLNYFHMTPLMFAAERNYPLLVEFLLANGADPDISLKNSN